MDALMAKKNTKGDEKIVAEAKKRFKRCQEWESVARARFVDDVRFVNADPDNGFQWPKQIFDARSGAQKPCLTLNKTRQHCLQIINDAKQNKPGVNVRPVGNGATFDAAQVYEGVVRHIEYVSDAEQVYDTATTHQVHGGIGYWRVVTDYADDDTFDQEIYIRRVKDPLTIYMDPDINEIDGSDARFAFVVENVAKDAFIADYPECEDAVSTAPLGSEDGWIDEHHVRVAEYYRVVERADVMFYVADEATGQQQPILASKLPPEVVAGLLDDETVKQREVKRRVIEWYKIAAGGIIDRTIWIGKYIPIVRVVGEEAIIDGKLDRKGHVRALKDAQRMYNYWSSSAVEHVALQNKLPYIAAIQAVRGFEEYWGAANVESHAYLPYNAYDDRGQPVPRPERQQPPQMATAYMQGMQVAQTEMMMVSGQYQAQMGQNENAKSGRAIAERQRQGDNATYHFIDGLAIGIKFTGKILIDLIPKVYDTPRVLRILAEDGTQQEVQVDPSAKQAFQAAQPNDAESKAAAIFNPKVGNYDVLAEVGPSYSTRRQEAFNAFEQIVAQNQPLVNVVGDIMFKNADFPGADEIAKRLERMVPPQAKGEAPPPDVAAMQQQMQHMQVVIQQMVEELADKERALKARDAETDIHAYDAETRRITAVANSVPEIGEDRLRPLIAMIIRELQSDGKPDDEDTGEAPNELMAGEAA